MYLIRAQNARPLAAGCHHNGTMYGDGSFVPTTEPCLSCKCRDKNLICSLRVCADQPVPPPRGCVLVQKLGVCCPYVTCSKFHLLNKGQDRRTSVALAAGTSEDLTNQQKMLSKNSLYRRIDDGDTDGNDERKCEIPYSENVRNQLIP